MTVLILPKEVLESFDLECKWPSLSCCLMPKVSMSLSQELHHGEDGAARGSPVGSGNEISLHIIGPGPQPGRAVASGRAHPEPRNGHLLVA